MSIQLLGTRNLIYGGLIMNNEYKVFVETRSWAGWQKQGEPTIVSKLVDIQDKVKEVTENLDANVLEFCIMVEVTPTSRA